MVKFICKSNLLFPQVFMEIYYYGDLLNMGHWIVFYIYKIKKERIMSYGSAKKSSKALHSSGVLHASITVWLNIWDAESELSLDILHLVGSVAKRAPDRDSISTGWLVVRSRGGLDDFCRPSSQYPSCSPNTVAREAGIYLPRWIERGHRLVSAVQSVVPGI